DYYCSSYVANKTYWVF
nr:immunoglobulin light chain junction region [Macaca mulatta]MOW28619.1 immunoglobulin light chain junction region [Macaca mulatta]MOW29267.1 immunoglobulin light chain junction region [Macaca mulatta]MOW30243.1 immunoglobulin light chain junction region [Macaca mulatta]